MAENETKPERKQIEMSIWVIILLIVVIVFMCVFMSMNHRLGEAQKKIDDQTSYINSLEARNRNLNEGVKALSEQTSDLSPNQLKARLAELLGVEVTVNVPETEPVSGEIISGEVTE